MERLDLAAQHGTHASDCPRGNSDVHHPFLRDVRRKLHDMREQGFTMPQGKIIHDGHSPLLPVYGQGMTSQIIMAQPFASDRPWKASRIMLRHVCNNGGTDCAYSVLFAFLIYHKAGLSDVDLLPLDDHPRCWL